MFITDQCSGADDDDGVPCHSRVHHQHCQRQNKTCDNSIDAFHEQSKC